MIKKSFLSTLCVFMIACVSFAGSPSSEFYRKLAETSVTSVYLEEGDAVSVKLVSLNHSEKEAVEVYTVTLTNGAGLGSIDFNVKVVSDQEGEGGIQVNINRLSGT